MSYTGLDSRLLRPLFHDETIAGLFNDTAFVQQMVAVESALAQVQGALGVIPQEAAAEIVTCLGSFEVDWEEMQTGIEKAGMPVAELVRQLRLHVGGTAASYVHWGATTQDILDSALVLQLGQALAYLEGCLGETVVAMRRLVEEHRLTLMAGRTHSQQALPITFGLKVAGWLAPLLRHQERLAELKGRLLVVQFGGAAGTLASLGEKGIVVQEGLAQALGLGWRPLPWHTQRDGLAELAGWLSLVSGSLAKMAQDIILLAQTEVGEVRETADPARGGSSTMPQKSNPMISETMIAAARSNAGLLGTMHQALIQEHERGTHGWQLEWLSLPQMLTLTAVSLNKALFLSENLVVNREKMMENVGLSNGLMMAEAISLALAEGMGRTAAKKLVTAACQQAFATGRHLVDVVQEQSDAELDWDALRDESHYLGPIEAMIDSVLGEVSG